MGKGFVSTPMVVVISLVILFIAIALLVQVWPAVRYGPFSPCWGASITKINNLAGMDLLKKPHYFSVGDCISAIHFVNEEEIDETRSSISNDDWDDYINCGEGKSFIFVVPIADTSGFGRKFWEWPKEIWDELIELWQEDLGGIGPICKVLDREKELERNVVLDSTVTYCIKIELNDDRDKRVVRYVEISPNQKCDDAVFETGGLLSGTGDEE
jgi:hypothetical protein